MDKTTFILIGILCFVGLVMICTIFYVFQPKYARSFRMFEKKKSKANDVAPIITTSSTSAIEWKPILSPKELKSFRRLNKALKNKNVVIFPKMTFTDFVHIKSIDANAKNPFYTILPYLKADFLICDIDTGLPLCIVRDLRIQMDNLNKSHIENIAEALKIKYIEINGMTDEAIIQIYNAIKEVQN